MGSNGTMFTNPSNNELARIASDGKVGIGTVPSHTFEIFSGSDHENIIQVKGTNPAGVYAGMGVYQGNAVFTGGGIGSNSAGIVFRTAASGSETEKVRIDSYGAFLVGTTAPLYTSGDVRHEIRKDVARAYSPTNMVAHSHLLINNSNTGSARFSSIGFRAGTGDGAIGFVYKDSANNADFVVVTDGVANGSEKVRIKNDGKMGVGTNNPQFMIHTEGSGNNGGVRLENSHTTTTVSGNTAAGAFPHNLILSNYGGSGNADNRLVSLGFDIPTTVSHANAQIVYQATGSNGVGDFQFWLENGNTTYERARLTGAGQFLMGTTSSTGARVIIQQNSSDTNPLDQQTCADSSGMRLHNYSFGTGRYTALSLECCNSSSVQSASIIAQSVASGTSPDIIIAQRTSNTANSERLRITSDGKVGISSSIPKEKLDVYGSINAGGENSPVFQIRNDPGTYIKAFKHYFDAAKGQIAGYTSNRTIVNITIDESFHQAGFEVTYFTRLQAVSDQHVRPNKIIFGVNRFNSASSVNVTKTVVEQHSDAASHCDVNVVSVSGTNYQIQMQFSTQPNVSSAAGGWIEGATVLSASFADVDYYYGART